MGILEMDPPMHRAYRRTIQPKFLMPEAMGWWRRRTIDSIVQRLIERMAKGDRADLNLDFCARIPVYTITTGIGLDGDEALRFRHAYLTFDQPEPQHDDGRPDQERPDRRGNPARPDQRAPRRAAGRSDLFLLDTMLMMPGEDPRPLTDREIMAHAKLVMVAGGGTSWRQMGITLFALLTHLDQFEEVKADRALIGDAIEEGLRWNPDRALFLPHGDEGHAVSTATTFPEGSVLELCLGPANRDPARWDNADAVRPAPREADQHGLWPRHPPLPRHECRAGGDRDRDQCAARCVSRTCGSTRMQPAPFITGGLEQQGVSGLPVLLR